MRNALLNLEVSIISHKDPHIQTERLSNAQKKTVESIDNLFTNLQHGTSAVTNQEIIELHDLLNKFSISNKDEFNFCNSLKYKLVACLYLLDQENENLMSKLSSPNFRHEASSTLFTETMTFAAAAKHRQKNQPIECTIL